MELRVRQLTQLLDKAQIIQGGDSSGRVTSGSIVSLRYEGDDEVERYLVGNIEERRDDLPVISPASPAGPGPHGPVHGRQGRLRRPPCHPHGRDPRRRGLNLPLPEGRRVGPTFVREVAGPAGGAGGGPPPRADGRGRPQLVRGVRRPGRGRVPGAVGGAPGLRPGPAAGAGPVPAGGPGRRRGRGRRRAGGGPVRARRLLDGGRGGAAGVAPAPGSGGGAGAGGDRLGVLGVGAGTGAVGDVAGGLGRGAGGAVGGGPVRGEHAAGPVRGLARGPDGPTPSWPATARR